MKYFIITVDTEGDNLWSYHKGDCISTENTLYIPRFQELCEKYNYKPVWLSNFEMINDERYVEYIKQKSLLGLCEVGIHIHAWNNPPLYELKGDFDGNPYLIEYPYSIMRSKFKETYDLICKKIGKAPVSHRAGRWAMNSDYFKLLKEFGILVDCSYTPLVSWSNNRGETISGGSDYTKCSPKAHMIDEILEVPMSIIKIHNYKGQALKHRLKSFLKGKTIWLRPAICNIDEMKRVVDVYSQKSDYVEFMIHSSELMPGGSPYFMSEQEVEDEYFKIEGIFKYAEEKGFEGITLDQYYKMKLEENENR